MTSRSPCTDPPVLPSGAALSALGFDSSPFAQLITSPDGHCIRANQALGHLLGWPPDELVGVHYAALTHPDDLPGDEAAFGQLFGSGGRGPSVEKRFRRRDGSTVWTRVTPNLIAAEDGSPLCAVVVVEDIDEHRHRHAELSRLALTDALTGVRNRALLDEDIDAALAARDREGGVVAVCYVDVDDFKKINDAHGHTIGDHVLVALSIRLREAVREEDTVARIGGDEFVLVTRLPTRAAAEELCARIRRLAGQPVVVDGGLTVPVSVSVGMDVVDGPGRTGGEVRTAADTAMYAVKRRRPR